MPIHDSGRVEFAIDSGHITIVTDAGEKVPAYWAHPRIGHRFSGIAYLHDWWGMDTLSRMMANFFAQMGYYVIAPDLYSGKLATSPQQAMQLLEATQDARYAAVNATLSVLESHHRVKSSVGAVGMGMGGTLAFEAAIKRDDLEASVAYAGFPQQFLGQFSKSNTPILAVYGSEEPYTKAKVIAHLQHEFSQTPLHDKHEIVIVRGVGHQLFHKDPNEGNIEASKFAINRTLAFLERHLEQPDEENRPTAY